MTYTLLCGLLLRVNMFARGFYTWVLFTPDSFLVTVGDIMRGIGSFPCPQEPAVWVRDHLSGILLGRMVKGVLALYPSPAADTATASEFFHQEKHHSGPHPFQIDLRHKGSQFHIIEVCRGSSHWACGPNTHTHRIKWKLKYNSNELCWGRMLSQPVFHP